MGCTPPHTAMTSPSTPEKLHPKFVNPDGTPATWIEEVSLPARRKAYLKCLIPGVALGLLIWSVQYSGTKFGDDYLITGLVPVFIGWVFAKAAFAETTKRRYSEVLRHFSQKERMLAAAWPFLGGVGMALFSWAAQYGSGGVDHLRTYWWYAWPSLLFIVIGLVVYSRRKAWNLTPKAVAAQKYFAEQGKTETANRPPGAIERFLSSVGSFIGGIFILCIIGAVLWAVFTGIAALPISVAIVIGAIIIAVAIGS